ncbi:uncharacterized protein LOC108180310 [Tachysurus ichikawai]
MVRILVSHLIERFGENPSAATKVMLASSVVEQFPFLKNCQVQVDFTDLPQASWRSVKKIRRGRQKTTSLEIPTYSSKFNWPEANVDSERATQMTEWLKNNIWPASQVEQYMKETAIQRAKWICDHGSKTIMEIVQEYPRLLDTPGMISQDFLIFNPDCSSNLSENWLPVFKDKILQFASKEKQALELLHNIEMMSAERQSDIAVQVLPVVLPTHIGTNMAEYLRSKESIEFPYILMLGDNQCFQAFTIINGAALQQSTLLAALDVCF